VLEPAVQRNGLVDVVPKVPATVVPSQLRDFGYRLDPAGAPAGSGSSAIVGCPNAPPVQVSTPNRHARIHVRRDPGAQTRPICRIVGALRKAIAALHVVIRLISAVAAISSAVAKVVSAFAEAISVAAEGVSVVAELPAVVAEMISVAVIVTLFGGQRKSK
jgi:hypothetical protein